MYVDPVRPWPILQVASLCCSSCTATTGGTPPPTQQQPDDTTKPTQRPTIPTRPEVLAQVH